MKGLSRYLILSVMVGASAVQAKNMGDWTGKRVSVVGDSYSAYGKIHGSGNSNYPGKTTVRNESQMWWAQVISEMGGILETNRSVSGSAMTVSWGLAASFYNRSKDGQLGHPDIILVLGGLNDFWMFNLDESSFRSGVGKFFNCLDFEYPFAQKFFVLDKIHISVDRQWGLAPMYRRVLRALAKERGYTIIDLEGYFGMDPADCDTPEYPHPTLQGMNKIAARVISAIKNGANDCARQYDYLELDSQGYLVTDYVPNLARTKVTMTVHAFDDSRNVENVLYSTMGGRSAFNVPNKTLSLIWNPDGLVYENSPDGGRTNVGPACGVTPSQDGVSSTIATCANMMSFGDTMVMRSAVAPDERAAGPLVIGGMQSTSNAPYAGMAPIKIYNVRIEEDGVLVHDFYPAKTREGTATLYDTVTETCLAVYGGGEFKAVDGTGPFVNYDACRAYSELDAAYAAASSGGTVVVREQPDSFASVTGRVDVVIDTRGHTNVEMVEPSPLLAISQEGGVLRVVRNEAFYPQFACTSMFDLFKPVDGKLKLHIANVQPGFYYAVFTATDLKGPWTQIGDTYELERADYEVLAPINAKSFFIKASVRTTP